MSRARSGNVPAHNSLDQPARHERPILTVVIPNVRRTVRLWGVAAIRRPIDLSIESAPPASIVAFREASSGPIPRMEAHLVGGPDDCTKDLRGNRSSW